MLTPLRVMIEISHHVIRYGIRRPARLRKQQASLTNCAEPQSADQEHNAHTRLLCETTPQVGDASVTSLSAAATHVRGRTRFQNSHKLWLSRILVGIRYP